MEKEAREEGVYLYCIANSGVEADFGHIGIEDRLVYTVPFRDIGAVVHRCHAEPYKTDDEEKAKDWILAHQYVVDLATTRFGTVIPLTFDTIFKGGDAVVEGWLRDEYDRLKGMLQRFEGKAEYGIKVYLDKEYAEEMVNRNEEIGALRKGLEGKPEGMAYLLRKRLEQSVKVQKDIETRSLAEKLRKRIAGLVDEIRFEQTKRGLPEKWGDKLMILNLSCLVKDDSVKALGNLLGEINDEKGLTVRFTGPWPPYSFVREVEEESEDRQR